MQKSKILSRAMSRDKNQNGGSKLKNARLAGFREFAFLTLHFEFARRCASAARRAGFTLIETIVALALIVTALAGPFTLVSQSIFSSRYYKNKLTALHLAQEGIEIIRQMRDTNALDSNVISGATNWLGRSGPCAAPCARIDDGDYNVDAVHDGPGLPLSTEIKPLGISADGLYDRTVAPSSATSFTRKVSVSCPAPCNERMLIVSEVTWRDAGFTRRVTLEETLYNWK